MGRPISYEMQMMFVGSSGAFEEAMNTGSGISRLDFIQSYDFSFNIERTPLKQIGSDSFATRQTQLAPDVNLNIQYYLNDGWNDKYIGLDIPTGATGNPFDSILSSTGDRNFYISIAQNDGMDQNLQTGIVNSNILAIGNAYITNYEISVAVNQLATVSCSFIGANANVQDYATSKYLPSVNTLVSGQNAQDANKNFSLNFVNNSRTERYLPKAKEIFDGGCPYSKCKITPDFQSGGGTSPITFGFFDAIANNFQSMQFSVQFERKALYGFGNNHPHIRKIQRPTVATLSLSALIDDFQAENLSKVFHAEGGTQKSMLIEFFNLQDVKKFGLSLQNLTLESYNLGARIGDRVLVETNWSVEVRNGASADIGMIGSYGSPLLDATKVNESFNVEELYYEIFAGEQSSIGLSLNKKVSGWGRNSSGSLGRLKTLNKSPTYIFSKQFEKLDSVGIYSLAIDNNGILWSWGSNVSGQLGNGTTTTRNSPTKISGQQKTFCQITTGKFSTSVAIDKYGKAWGWGYNNRGQVGDNSTVNKSTPVAVCGSQTFCKIVSGYGQVLAIDKYGKAWAWGTNSEGRLGIGNIGITSVLTPVSVYGSKTFCEISAYFHSVGIDRYGKAWAWGGNSAGMLGNGSTSSSTTPISVYGNKTFCKISAGYLHTLAIDKYGKVWAWGSNNYGQLGDFSYTSRLTPVAVYGNKTFCKISAGFQYSLALDHKNRAWSWGTNSYTQLGINSSYTTPRSLNLINSQKTFCTIKTNEFSSLAIDKNGKAWGWGYNLYHELGNGTLAIYRSPVSVYGNKTFCQINLSNDYSTALDKNGKAWAWGTGANGKLGNGGTISQITPVSVYGAKTFCHISSSDQHSLAIDKNGILWAWGSNGNAALGIGTISGCSVTPVAVYGSKTFCKIAVANGISFAIDKNGQVWAWGYNRFRGLGVATATTLVSTPTAIVGTTKTFCSISTGMANYNINLAIDNNNKLWGWGNILYINASGGMVLSPRQISNVADKTFCKIHAGPYQSFVTDKNGSTWSWGDNILGGLANDTLTSVRSPVPIVGQAKTFCQIVPSRSQDSFALGLDKNGKIWSWGSFVPNGILGEFDETTPRQVFNI